MGGQGEEETADIENSLPYAKQVDEMYVNGIE
jgi:hypothetical protein